MRSYVLTSGFGASTLIACVQGLSPEACNFPFGGHGSSGVPFDLGNGIVANEGGDEQIFDRDSPGYVGFLGLEDCKTGAVAQITFSSQPFDQKSGEFGPDRYDSERIDEFKDAARSEQGFASIVGLAKEYGYPVGQRVVYQDDAKESCRCRAFYPNLRGEKEPYEVRT